MKIKILSGFIIFLAISIQQRAFAQESIIQDVTDAYVEKLVEVAKTNFPRHKSFESKVDIAKANVSSARLSLFDALSVSYIYQPGNTTTIDPVNPSTSYFKGLQAGVFLNLGSLLRTPVNVRKAKSELQVAQNDQAEYDLTLATEVRKRYYLYVQRLAQLKLQTRSRQQAENAAKDMEYKYKKGEETFDAYNKILIQLTEHSESKISAEGNLFIAKADLEELLGQKLETIK
ncbi:hypothetical protein GCM10023149_17950 [Mucilaginibacter gynuensis]|uniref:Outer membrane efflux protein n=1 Tax=Mucilaginibacter gynuensis TaxID=1302236 RepID=A0ABP8G822_9SPHI